VLFELNFSEQMWLAWPNTPLEVIATRDPFADYLFAHYRPCSVIGAKGFSHYAFMVRKEDGCN
jgi:hypothetical protein